MGLPIENLRRRWIDHETGECLHENDRPCGARATEFFQACVPKDVGCPIRKFQIVRKTEKIKKYINSHWNRLNPINPETTGIMTDDGVHRM